MVNIVYENKNFLKGKFPRNSQLRPQKKIYKKNGSPHSKEKLFGPHGGQEMWSTIPVKDSHLFKIVELVFSFYLKLHNFK